MAQPGDATERWGVVHRSDGRAGMRSEKLRHGMVMTRGGKVKSRYDLQWYCIEQPGSALAMIGAVRTCYGIDGYRVVKRWKRNLIFERRG